MSDVPMFPPRALCSECEARLMQNNPTTHERTYLSVYCAHNQVGALFYPAMRRWTVRCPISEARFYETLKETCTGPDEAYVIANRPS
jgi:hypothetical protein